MIDGKQISTLKYIINDTQRSSSYKVVLTKAMFIYRVTTLVMPPDSNCPL